VLETEFSSIWVLNLRGNARTQGELRKREAGNVFGSGSRTPIVITLLVKTETQKNEKAKIFYHDIGDYLSGEEKLAFVKKFRSLNEDGLKWMQLQSNEHGDWINHRNDNFSNYIPMGEKKGEKNDTIFHAIYSNGVKTNRDAWVYNSNRSHLIENMTETIRLYNMGLKDFIEKSNGVKDAVADDYIDFNQRMITWTREIKWDIEKGKIYEFEPFCIRTALYRPFCKQLLYFNKGWNNMQYQRPKQFPAQDTCNLVICVSGVGVTKEFSVIMTNVTPDLELIGKSQCFPLYYFKETSEIEISLFDTQRALGLERRDGLTEFSRSRAKKQYGKNVNKEDIFYYVYGILHSKSYLEIYSSDLKKMLPHIPLVE
jgi:predicted helicase